MKTFLLGILFVLGAVRLSGQTPRGAEAELPPLPDGGTVGKLRAVVVGVSKYAKLPANLQLNFADRDAEAFHQFLLTQPNADRSNIYLLTNEKAGVPEFKARLTEAYRSSAAGDLLLIYFAGHGNLQRGDKEGFLLFHDINQNDSEYFLDGAALPLSVLAQTERACVGRNVKFVVITDACHSGKLISESGAQTTLAILNAQWENSLKLVSSQTNQYSYEDTELKHGYFTHFLLESFKRSSDTVGIVDGILEPAEFRSILTTAVGRRSKRLQTPSVVGNDNFPLFVHPNWAKEHLAPVALNDKPSDGGVGRSVSTSGGRGLVNAFYESLSENRLLSREEELPVRLSAGPFVTKNIAKGGVKLVAVSPSGEWVAALTSQESGIRIFRSANSSFSEAGVLRTASGVAAIAFSPGANRLWAALANGTLEVWDCSRQQRVTSFPAQARVLAFSPDGSKLASADFSGSIKMWDVQSMRVAFEIKSAHAQAINHVQWMDASTFVTGSNDQTARIWKWGQVNPVVMLKAHNKPMSALMVDRHARFIYTADEGGQIYKWSGEAANAPKPLLGKKINNQIFDLSLTLDGRALLVGGWNSKINIVRTDNLTEQGTLLFANRGIARLCQTPDGQQLVMGNWGGEVVFGELTQPPAFANYLFEQIVNSGEYDSLLSQIRGDYSAALLSESMRIVQALVAGAVKVPDDSQIQQAIRQLEYLNTLQPDEGGLKSFIQPRLVYLKGSLLKNSTRLEDLNQALDYFSSLLKANPDATYPLVAMAAVYRKKNEMEKATGNLNQAANQLPKWTEPKSNLGQIELAAGRTEQARKYFDEVVALEPNNPKGYRWLGELELQLGNTKMAEQQFRKALSLDPGNPVLLSALSEIERLRGNFDGARSLLGEALKADSLYAPAYTQRALIEAEVFGRFTREESILANAYRDIERARRLGGSNPTVFQKAGMFWNLFMQGADSALRNYAVSRVGFAGTPEEFYVMALGDFNKAIELAPYEGSAYWQKVLFLLHQGKALEAGRVLDAQRQIMGAGLPLSLNQANLALREGRYEVATRLFNEATRQAPANGSGWLGYLRSLRLGGKGDVAAWNTLTLTGDLSKNALLLYELAVERAQWPGQGAQADRWIQDVRALDPSNRFVVTLQRNLKMEARSRTQMNGEPAVGWEQVTPLSTDYTMVKVNGQKWLAEATGDLVMKYEFEDMVPVGGDLFAVRVADRWGLWNRKKGGAIVLSYSKVERAGRFVKVFDGRKVGLLDATGRMIAPVSYFQIDVHDDFAAIRFEKGWGAIDFNGKLLVKATYDLVKPAQYRRKNVIEARWRGKAEYYTFSGECLNCKK